MKPHSDLLPNTCCHCATQPATVDKAGLLWCENCEHRRQIMDWGVTHQYPNVVGDGYGIAPSHLGYAMVATFSTDEIVWTLLGVIWSQEAAKDGEVA